MFRLTAPSLAAVAIVLFALAALAPARAGLPAVHAQPPPGGTPRPQDETMFRRYATRHVVPLPAAGSVDGRLTLHVFNNGDFPTQLVVLELASAPAPAAGNCPNGLPTERIVALHCLKSVPADGTLDIEVSSPLATSALVYSMSRLTDTIACDTIAAVQSGTQPLDAWERQVWARFFGEPVAVVVEASGSSGRTAVTGRTGFEVGPGRPPTGQSPGQGQGPPGALRLQILPLVQGGDGAGGMGNVRLVNPTSQCQTVQARSAAASATGANCQPPDWAARLLPAYSAADLGPFPVASAAAAVAITGTGQAMAMAEHAGADGWWTYVGGHSGGPVDATSLAFPLAVSPFTNETSELWVTNQHPTATAKIDIIAWNGNGQLVKAYTDPLPLCAGATRKYDPRAIIGTLGPTASNGRNLFGWQLPAMASLRVESSNRSLPEAPPIGAVMVLRNALGTTAYAGQGMNNEVEMIRNPRINRVRVVTVVPDVKINFGSPPESTFLAGQNLADPQANFMQIDLYDSAGTLVAEGIEVPLGAGLSGASTIDLGVFAGHRFGTDQRAVIPPTFHGSATIRGSDAGPFGQIMVLAVNHRAGDITARRMNPPTPMPPLAGWLPWGLDWLPPGAPSRDQTAVDSGTQTAAASIARLTADSVTQTAADRLALVSGVFVPHWLAANAATPAPRPTVPRTPDPSAPTSTSLPPGRATATPTPAPGAAGPRIWLPALRNGGDAD